MDNLGHIFKVKHPDNNEWIEIPVLFQTMYQAYVAYCKENNKDVALSESEFYDILGELRSLKATVEEYLDVAAENANATLSLSKGGTGTSVQTLAKLLEYLGLTTNIDSTGNKFPTTETVKAAIDRGVTSAKTYADSRINNAFETFTLLDLGVTAGTVDPNYNTMLDGMADGAIYIKYDA
jgi:hypothetical protein